MKYTNYKKLDNLSDMIPSGTPDGWLYIGDDNVRYLLGEPKEKNILVFGVNPSTATPLKLDPTLRSVKAICQNNTSECGWIMANIYPLRATDFDLLPYVSDNVLSQNNIHIIKTLMSEYKMDKIWAAWGGLIDKRPYLFDELLKLTSIFDDKSYNWHSISILRNGHPGHPLFKKHNSILKDFNIRDYIEKHYSSDGRQ